MNAFRLLAVLIPLFTSGGGRGIQAPPDTFDYYVSPTGSAGNDGLTVATPWSLPHALSNPGGVFNTEGKVVGMLNGAYVATHWVCGLVGVTFRAVNYWRAIIDNTSANPEPLFKFTSASARCRLWDLQFRYTGSDIRTSAQAGSNPTDIGNRFEKSIYDEGDDNKVINPLIHDTANGVAGYSFSIGLEVNGAIIWNNGWIGPDRMHGHSIYMQNQTGIKTLIDLICFGSFAPWKFGGSETSSVQGLLAQGLCLFNSGPKAWHIAPEDVPEVYWGQLTGATNGEVGDSTFEHSILYKSYSELPSTVIRFNDEAPVGTYAAKRMTWRYNIWTGAATFGTSVLWEYTHNTPVNNDPAGAPFKRVAEIVIPDGDSYSTHLVNENDIYAFMVDAPLRAYIGNNPAFQPNNFPLWQSTTGWDDDSTQTEALTPTGARVYYRQSSHDPGYGQIRCLNWGQPGVTGDAGTDTFTKVAHGYSNGTRVAIGQMNGGAGLALNTSYFIVNKTDNTFQLSDTEGGAAKDFTTNVTNASVVPATLNVLLSAIGLVAGDNYKIWHVYNLIDDPAGLELGTPDYEGTYDGSTPLTLEQVGYIPPVPYGGGGLAAAPSASPVLNPFVVRKV